MRFIFLAFIVGFIIGNFSANAVSLPETFIKLGNSQTCKVSVSVWLSPSCAHCAGYFSDELPKITSIPGFCVDLHFLPHLYPTDMPIAVLIWSQGKENVKRIAELFYKGQNEWLDNSVSRNKVDDSRRVEDLNDYFNIIKNDKSKNLEKIKRYLDPKDPFLYVKIFALKYFSVEHLEEYLPKGGVINANLSLALLKDLPIKDDRAVNFSPAFSIAGKIIPDSELSRGILTKDVAEKMVKAAATLPYNNIEQPLPTPVKKQAPKKVKKSQAIEFKPDENDFQDADGDIDFQDPDEEEDEEGDFAEEDPEEDEGDELGDIIDELTN